MKKVLLILLLLVGIIFLAFKLKPFKNVVETVTVIVETPNLIHKDCLTISTRVRVPKDYKRLEYANGSFEEYIRNYKLKNYGSEIINYDDTKYFWQEGHIGILEISVQKWLTTMCRCTH